jgi:hypothetical protein
LGWSKVLAQVVDPFLNFGPKEDVAAPKGVRTTRHPLSDHSVERVGVDIRAPSQLTNPFSGSVAG